MDYQHFNTKVLVPELASSLFDNAVKILYAADKCTYLCCNTNAKHCQILNLPFYRPKFGRVLLVSTALVYSLWQLSLHCGQKPKRNVVLFFNQCKLFNIFAFYAEKRSTSELIYLRCINFYCCNG